MFTVPGYSYAVFSTDENGYVTVYDAIELANGSPLEDAMLLDADSLEEALAMMEPD